MSNNDLPAGSPGGPAAVPALDDLPERMRVHALAKRLARTSREVLAALATLGVEVRSAQSSVERKVAEQVAAALTAPPEQASPDPAFTEQAAGEGSDPATAPAPAADERAAEQGAPAAALAPVFAPPAPLFQAPTRRSRKKAVEPAEQAGESEPAPAPAVDTAEAAPAAPATDEGDDDDDASGRRRRRRGRRGRGRGRGADGADEENGDEENGDESTGDEDSDESTGEDGEGRARDTTSGEDDDTDDGSESDESDESGRSDGESGGSRRRRRRRRRRGSGDDGDTSDEVDPPNTVTKVRAPREPREQRDDEGDGVQSVRGSTRLEAKRQRRRDGRDAGRRRVPILSEAEFLARRESVDRSMVVRERGDRVEIAVLEDDVLVEHFVAGRDGGSMVGNIYLGRVQNVLPSMEAAFVDIGRGRNAVLYAGEVDWEAAGLGGKQRRIEQALSSGDSVLVQVTKDPIGHKGARLTTQISLAGRFLVYVPSGGAAGISRKLPDVERKRLKDMLKEIVPSEAGVIIRTASEGVSHEALERDVRRLQAQWEVVKGKAEATGPSKPKAPTLLYEEPDLLIKVVRDQFNEDFSRLVVEGDEAWETLSNYVGHVAPELGDRLHRHVGITDVFAEHRIDDQLLKALDRKVWLPSGGTLVIDRTEAMTVVDVNTGKFTGSGGNLEETVTRNNLEAAEEIVRQLRLRDIGGIIVIDFIDMVLEANRDLVLRRLTECLARDRTRHQVAEVTSLGLVQMTRKRVGGGLLEHFSTPCEHCRGRGVVVTTEPEVGSGQTAARNDRSEREGRRSRGRGRRDGEDRNGHDVRKAEPVADGNGAATPAPSGSASGRNGRSAETSGADAAVDVGAPAPVVTPAALDATGETPAPPAPVAETPAEPKTPSGRRVRRSARRPAGPSAVETSPADGPADVAADAVEEVVVERSVAAAHSRPEPDATEKAAAEKAAAEKAAAEKAAAEKAAADKAAADKAAADMAAAEEAVATSGGTESGTENGVAEPRQDADGEQNGRARGRRRGRVTRTAGSPTATVGDTPVAAVVTVASTPEPTAAAPSEASSATPPTVPAAAEPAVPVTAPPQPEPAPAARPRRTRRAASRPAGPPVAEGGSDPA
ncbi:translation initiation factor IF-2 N-terminal domain-containing protein [Pseudonocardia sp. MH-G8]|uniref:translation initiation factor IF-2 N-terminal domain-containing protein n=1 Tax=Pseudonocardia sp. MH-G8 TaxID=1854588 RepID=UPI000BA18BF3|nr:translation initiation factor IF-2 N-terminal domain-containing protein [Pseudonocardia sp. MH-G8]OZM79210.1 ribonuclease E/G [Pseudonocardia sp. MH-G8]